MLLAGCGNVTDGVPPELGRCVETTSPQDWWPLDEGRSWVYEVTRTEGSGPDDTRKEWRVESAPGPVGGRLVPQHEGVRIWRGDREKAGWRWTTDEESAIWFARDVWVDWPRLDDPCGDLGPDGDFRRCFEDGTSPDGATLAEESYYLPGRKRLDYRADRVCEGSAWTETYRELKIAIGAGDGECALEDWLSESPSCAGTISAPIENHWSVVSIDRHILVPAGVFDHCLCVRRIEGTRDQTYCYARGIGKVYELDRNNLVECLAQSCIDGVCEPAQDLAPCDEHQLDD